jgi:prephenate dehydrogenase
MKIVILGGTSGFGRWLAQQAKEFSKKYNLNLDIWITGRNLEKGKKVAQELGVNFSNSNIEAVKDADIVIVAVTIGNTKKVINEV